MPYEWLPPKSDENHLHLWPHRSLTPAGFVAFIGTTALLIALPAIPLIGTPLLWVLLPFPIIAVTGIWAALRRNQRDTEIIEDLTLTPGRVALVRHGPRGRRQEWEANPHWVQVTLHPTGGPVPQYLTLRGGGREVELGAFLTEAERVALAAEVRAALAARR
jgi:uncharacterized membrane protein